MGWDIDGPGSSRLPYAQGDVLACLPICKATNRLRVLCCTETRVTLSPKPFINADILSPQIHSQIVKVVSYTQPPHPKKKTRRPSPSVLPLTQKLSLSPLLIRVVTVPACSYESHHPPHDYKWRVPTTVWPISVTKQPSNVSAVPLAHIPFVTSACRGNFLE